MKKIFIMIIASIGIISCSNDINSGDSGGGETDSTPIAFQNIGSVILQEDNNYNTTYMLDKNIFSVGMLLSSNDKNIKFNNTESLSITEDIMANGVNISVEQVSTNNNVFGSEFIIYADNNPVINGYIVDNGNQAVFTLDPYKTETISSPLAGVLDIITKDAVKIKYEIMNRDNKDTVDVSKISNEFLTNNKIDIYGLYENYSNIVRIIGYNSDNSIVFSYNMTIQTDNVVVEEYENDKVLNIKVNNSNTKGWFITHYKNGTHPGILIDEDGYVRWVLKNTTINYGFPVSIVDDNVIEIVPYRRNSVQYYSFTGKEYEDKRIQLSTFGYQVHHDVYHKKDGKYLIPAQKIGAETLEDIVLEYDPILKEIINVWDFKKVFEGRNRQIIFSYYSLSDWLHINSVWHDEKDNTIIISARHQGVIKATYPDKDGNFEILWWLTPHTQVEETNPNLVSKLLQPIDKNGSMIEDENVKLGTVFHDDFEWNRGQHSAVLLKNGNILLYDNGNDRPYVKSGEEYSRLVEYKIDENAMTVQEIRQYGRELGLEMYSFYRSNVWQFDNSNYFISSASVKQNLDIKEIDINNNVLYDAKGLWVNYRTYKQKIFDEHYID